MNKYKLIGLCTVLLGLALFSTVFAQSYNYEYVNVTTTVNITNAMPEILSVTINDPITLNAGGLQTVSCNATIRDWNGFNDISSVNATFYYFENSTGPDHNNTHYTNTSCAEVSNDGVYLANYTCTFDVQYYANNGSWTCNISAEDVGGLTDSNSNDTNINALFALNVTDVIDYGNLSVTDTSSEVVASVTNFGNTDINVSVLGYGEVEGDGIGLVCDVGTNISVEYQRFLNAPSIYDAKTNLSAVNQDLDITLNRPTQETVPITSNTYWQLYVPPNPFGVCTGTVRFTATTP